MKDFQNQIAEDMNSVSTSAQENGADDVQKSISSEQEPKSPKNPTKDTKANANASAVESLDKPGTFSDKILKTCPQFAQDCVNRIPKPKNKGFKDYYDQTCDIMILGILTVVSGVLPNCQFFYNRKWCMPNLMTVIVAIAGFGKGILESVFQLITPINKQYEEEYKNQMQEYKKQQKEIKFMSKKELKEANIQELEKPHHLFYRIPADITYAAMLKALEYIKGLGEMLETEIDTLANAIGNEWGNFTSLIRKNFQHEEHVYYRKTDDEYVNISLPQFSMLLSGTLDQLKKLMPDAKNGFFSRLDYYFSTAKLEWLDVDFNEGQSDDNTFFNEQGERFLKLFNKLKNNPSYVQFKMTEKQQKKFNKTFSILHRNYTFTDGDDMHATVVRLGIIMNRIALVFTMLRELEYTDEEQTEHFKQGLVCSDTDFNNAMEIVKVLLRHASSYYQTIADVKEEVDDKENVLDYDFGDVRYSKAFASLPKDTPLTSQDIIDSLINEGVPQSTAKKQIKRFCRSLWLKKEKHNQYRKLSKKEFMMVNTNKKSNA